MNYTEHILSILKKYVRVQGDNENRHLIFKGVSPFKNKRDFEELERWVKRND